MVKRVCFKCNHENEVVAGVNFCMECGERFPLVSLEILDKAYKEKNVSCLKARIQNESGEAVECLECRMEIEERFAQIYSCDNAGGLPAGHKKEYVISFKALEGGELGASLFLTLFFDAERAEVYRCSPVILKVEKEDTRPVQNIFHIEQKLEASQAGDVGRGGASIHVNNMASRPSSEEERWCPVLLQYDRDLSEKAAMERRRESLEERKNAVVLESVCSSGLDYCYLEIQERDEVRYVYLIARPNVVLGRSTDCEIQTCAINSKGEPAVEWNSLISKKHCQILYRGDEVLLQDIGTSQEHNATMLGLTRLKPQETKILESKQKIRIGRLNMTAKFFLNPSHLDKEGEKALEANPDELWQKYGGYDKPGKYACVQLSYYNNPYKLEEYILLYKYAQWGRKIENPIPLFCNIPDLLGQFRYQNGRIWVENLCPGYEELYVKEEKLMPGKAMALVPNMQIRARDMHILVRVE